MHGKTSDGQRNDKLTDALEHTVQHPNHCHICNHLCKNSLQFNCIIVLKGHGCVQNYMVNSNLVPVDSSVEGHFSPSGGRTYHSPR